MGRWTPRPRLLYGALFAHFAIVGGRFMGPFLRHEAGFSDTMVGSVLATRGGIAALLGSAGGAWADRRERIDPGKGRAQVMFLGITIGAILFLLHGTHHLVPEVPLFRSIEWHFALRILEAALSSPLVIRVMDGLTLSHLEKDPHSDQSDYGKERLHGAIWWAVANMVIGPLLDLLGFSAMYWLTMLSTAVTFVCIGVYVNGQESIELDYETTRELSPVEDPDEPKLPGRNRRSRSHEVSMWTLLMLMVGTSNGVTFLFATSCLSAGTSVVDGLVFLFFEYLGGSNTMCGATVALTVLFEIPIFHVAPLLLRRFGAGVLQQVACIAYVTRVVGYSLIPQGHIAFVLLLEPLHGVTFACAQTSAVDYAAQLMPKGYESSGQGLLAPFQGVGSVTGLFVAGVMEDTLGPRIMYRSFACIVSVGMIVFGMSMVCCSSRRSTEHTPLPQCDGVELPGLHRVMKDKDSSLEEPDDVDNTADEPSALSIDNVEADTTR